MNVDDMRNENTRRIIVGRAQMVKIDISMIQETHQIQDGESEEGGGTYSIQHRQRRAKKKIMMENRQMAKPNRRWRSINCTEKSNNWKYNRYRKNKQRHNDDKA